MAEPQHIVVIGAGIVGASIAWHLAAAGARVTVVEAGEPGGVATPCSFAWINASFGNPEPYFRLRLRSMAEWRRLADAVPGIPLAWCGGLKWDFAASERAAFLRQHLAWGYGVRAVDRAEAARLEPALAEPPDTAVHVAEEGVAEPRATALALLEDAVQRGAKLLVRAPVRRIATVGGRVTGIATADNTIAADHVVLAAGTGSPALAAGIGLDLPLLTSPGLIAHSRPIRRRLLRGLVMAPGLHMRQTAEGRVIAAAEFGGSDPGPDPGAVAAAVLAKAASLLRDASGLALDFHTVGWRPLPADRFPVVGVPASAPGLYLAVMHSGITLAPAVGRFAAAELLTGHRDPLLAPYGWPRPD
ncbi:NAD(P)/FAD-dependent oxidoreductase [Desertibaculum subflavum]|uniref:NAD(P)/FAD-dependent oxidoreductase n=1 Tax=Desertibaculum subflavum TaxID=2268458 RepID=UPI000E660FC8